VGFGNSPDLMQMNAKVQKMIAETLMSDGVEEIFKMGQDDTGEVDIFDPDLPGEDRQDQATEHQNQDAAAATGQGN
jgi:hypothetical protein